MSDTLHPEQRREYLLQRFEAIMMETKKRLSDNLEKNLEINPREKREKMATDVELESLTREILPDANEAKGVEMLLADVMTTAHNPAKFIKDRMRREESWHKNDEAGRPPYLRITDRESFLEEISQIDNTYRFLKQLAFYLQDVYLGKKELTELIEKRQESGLLSDEAVDLLEAIINFYELFRESEEVNADFHDGSEEGLVH